MYPCGLCLKSPAIKSQYPTCFCYSMPSPTSAWYYTVSDQKLDIGLISDHHRFSGLVDLTNELLHSLMASHFHLYHPPVWINQFLCWFLGSIKLPSSSCNTRSANQKWLPWHSNSMQNFSSLCYSNRISFIHTIIDPGMPKHWCQIIDLFQKWCYQKTINN